MDEAALLAVVRGRISEPSRKQQASRGYGWRFCAVLAYRRAARPAP